MNDNNRKRYALIGAGNRARMYLYCLADRYKDSAELVAMCDPNPARLDYYNDVLVKEHNYHAVPTYDICDFDKMVTETKADVVIVTTIDRVHHEYIARAMDLGCDAITEKPMTIDDEKCRVIFDAIERTGKNLRVAFNYRWAPGPSTLYKALRDGVIGDIIHVHLEYLLNTQHGADYFRRWHREKDQSGGLMVHKSTHHFDLVNWLINAVPETVFGMGELAFYGRQNAEKRGIEIKYDRYTGNDTKDDPFAYDLSSTDRMRRMYLEAEQHDGYIRDRNVFGENITIEDTMSVLVRYRTGAVLNYSLNAYLPREGYHLSINGTKGRVEYQEAHEAHIIGGTSEKKGGEDLKWETSLRVLPLFDDPYNIPIPKAEGSHGGADPLMQDQIFLPNAAPDALRRDAGHEQGAASILIGVAANKSFASGGPIQISDLCPQLDGATHLSDLA